MIVNALSKAPFTVGQICHDDDHRMLNWEILRSSVRVALHLRDLGLGEGDVLALAAGNRRYVASVVFGCYLQGVPVNTLDPTFHVQDVTHILRITLPKIVVCDPENYGNVERALKELENPAPVFVLDVEEEDGEVKWRSIKDLLQPHPEENDFV